MPILVLFVCLGNICRSPLAEAALRAEADRLGLDIEVDSAGTGDCHIGRPPDDRAKAVAREHGIDVSGQRARQVTREDFNRFDHIIALDPANLADLAAVRPEGAKGRLSLLLDHVEGRSGQAVADPYYGNQEHFMAAWTDVMAGARALARKIATRR